MPRKRKTLSFERLIGAPEYLYHYTSSHGVNGILNNKVVWASVLHFLNDSKEWKHTFELARTQVLRRLWERKEDAEWDRPLNELSEWLENHNWDV